MARTFQPLLIGLSAGRGGHQLVGTGQASLLHHPVELQGTLNRRLMRSKARRYISLIDTKSGLSNDLFPDFHSGRWIEQVNRDFTLQELFQARSPIDVSHHSPQVDFHLSTWEQISSIDELNIIEVKVRDERS